MHFFSGGFRPKIGHFEAENTVENNFANCLVFFYFVSEKLDFRKKREALLD